MINELFDPLQGRALEVTENRIVIDGDFGATAGFVLRVDRAVVVLSSETHEEVLGWVEGSQ